MNYVELENLLATVGTSFVGLSIETVPVTVAAQSKPEYHNVGGSDCKAPKVLKRSTFTGFLMGKPSAYGQRLQGKANKRLAEIYGENADIAVSPVEVKTLWGGKGRHGRGANIYHADTKAMYMAVFVDCSRHVPTVEYVTPSGEIIPASEIHERESSDVKTLDLGNGVTCEVVLKYRIVKYASLRRLRIDGQEHTLTHSAAEMRQAWQNTTAAAEDAAEAAAIQEDMPAAPEAVLATATV